MLSASTFWNSHEHFNFLGMGFVAFSSVSVACADFSSGSSNVSMKEKSPNDRKESGRVGGVARATVGKEEDRAACMTCSWT